MDNDGKAPGQDNTDPSGGDDKNLPGDDSILGKGGAADDGKGSDDDAKAKGKDGDDKGADDDKGKDAPESYEAFTMPEGVEVDQAMLDRFTPIAKEMGLTQEQAQKLVSLYAEQGQAAAKEKENAWIKTNEDWRNELKADKEFGGDKFNENCGMVAKVVDTFGDSELKQMLKETGMGNHPALVKFAFRVSKGIGEDKFGGAGQGGGAGGEKSRAERIYPDQAKPGAVGSG